MMHRMKMAALMVGVAVATVLLFALTSTTAQAANTSATCTVNPGPSQRVINIVSAVKGEKTEPAVIKAQADVASVKTACDAAIADSATFRNKVKEIAAAKITLNVENNDADIFMGEAVKGGAELWIDMGDIKDLSKNDFTTGTDADKNTVISTFLTRVLSHELAHVAGKQDPPTVGHDTVSHANAVAADLGTDDRRNGYSKTDKAGNCVVNFKVGGRSVVFNVTGFPAGEEPFADCPSVGGIAELPDVAGTPLATADSSGLSAGGLAGITAPWAVGPGTPGGACSAASRYHQPSTRGGRPLWGGLPQLTPLVMLPLAGFPERRKGAFERGQPASPTDGFPPEADSA